MYYKVLSKQFMFIIIVSLASSFHLIDCIPRLLRWLYDRNITSSGTIQTNRKGIPLEVKELKER